MSEFQLLCTYNSSDRDVTGYWRNVIGSPVLLSSKISAGEAGDASPIAGVYRFRFETATTVSVRRVNLQDSSNPLLYSGVRTVVCDYMTENINFLPGWGLVFRGDVQVGDEFEIGIGCYLNGTQWVRILSFGPRLAGSISTDRTLKAKNVSAGTLTDCIAVATNAIRVKNDQAGDRPFATFTQTGVLNPEPDDDLNGAEVTFDNYVAVVPATGDLLLNGQPCGVWDVAAEEANLTGEGLICDGETYYQISVYDENDFGFVITSEFSIVWDEGLEVPDGLVFEITNQVEATVPTFDILVDGDSIDLYDVKAGTLVPGGTQLTTGTTYRFADGTKYQSGQFTLSDDLEATDTATIYVSDGGAGVWLAPDGGSFVPGVQGIDLTERGQDDGVIAASGQVEFQIRISPASAETADLNQRSFSLRLVGLDGGGDEVDLEHQGSFLVAQGDGQLLIRITATNEAYQRPRYAEDPENPGEYIPDEGGEYVEDLINPGSFVHYSADPNNGNYGNYLDYLAANGVTFVDA